MNASEELAAFSARLAAAPLEWRKEMAVLLKSILLEKGEPAVRQAALSGLPRSGGVNAVIANRKISSSAVVAGPNITARMKYPYRGGYNADKGYIDHPVFGNRNVWARTTVEPGWFTDTVEKLAPEVSAAVVELMVEMNEALQSHGY